MLDGNPIVAIVVLRSSNTKTGDMSQLFILPEEKAPHEAQKTGEDASVCGACPQRPALGGSCYVRTFQGPRSTWQSNKGSPVLLEAALGMLAWSRALRLGAYGDPAALPESLVASLVKAVGRRITGYTHQWRDARFAWLRSYVMASADEPADMARARAEGWRTFRVVKKNTPWVQADFEIPCPAVELGVECVQCRLCDGSQRADDRRKSITIQEH
jgi:hypothetical protein